ncbi:MAG: hypothetical protein ACYCTD_05600 [bacterium]
MHKNMRILDGLAYCLSAVFFILIMPGLACSETAIKPLVSGKSKVYYTDSKRFIVLKMSKKLNAYINKKNQKVYYYYNKIYYFWAKGIWFDSKKIKGMFSITPQSEIPQPLKHGPILRVKRKNIPAGFAALKVPPQPVKHELPNAATEHLYNLPLTLHGLVIYQKNFNFNKINSGN